MENNQEHHVSIYRAAITWIGETVEYTVDLDEAKSIHRDVIRRERAAAWHEADAAWFKAMDADDAAATTTARAVRVKMRDAPAHASIAAAATVEALQLITLATILASVP